MNISRAKETPGWLGKTGRNSAPQNGDEGKGLKEKRVIGNNCHSAAKGPKITPGFSSSICHLERFRKVLGVGKKIRD